MSSDSLAMLGACEMEEPDLPEISNPSTSMRHELLSRTHRRRHDRAQADVGWPPNGIDSFDAGELRGDSTLRRPRQAPDEQRDEARASPGFCEEEHEHTTVFSLQLPSQRQPNDSEQPRCASMLVCFGLSYQNSETA